MVTVRKADERGHATHGWLDAYHTFSFNTFYDPAHMGFRALRVMNEDRIAPGRGFGTHPHNDMEIVTYVVGGALEHRDSMGKRSVLRAGGVQRMSAGTGITHSEFNASKSVPVHLYQIWLLPEREGIEPSYEERALDPAALRGDWHAIVTHDGRGGSMRIHQDVAVLLATLDAENAIRYPLAPGRHAWLQVVRGIVTVNGVSLAASDGAALSDETVVDVSAETGAEVMLFDLA